MSLRYFPLDGTDFRLSMGLQALRDRSWLDVDENYEKDLEEKQLLLRSQRTTVFAETEGTRAAQQEILDLVLAEFERYYPEICSPDDFRQDESPLVGAASLVQEDLVLMREEEEGYALAAACLCFPTGWNLIDKVGKIIRRIHQPVPGLNDRMGAPIDRFFRNLKPGKKVERFNWGLYDSAALFQPGWWRSGRPIDQTVTAETVSEKIFFRVERQTLQRLANETDILFTIRIFNNTLEEVASDRIRAARLLHGLETMDEAMQNYKSMPRYDKLIKNFLEQTAI
ncbi:MAG: DUF3445 domain-containing protein [Sneathiella sp.]|nr:DUF3445 domain-containing protein [Sneathiella sp.]